MSTEAVPVHILMAVYNGAPFLKEQLRSMIGQTYTTWRLYIRDDGSTDDSASIIDRFAADNPERIRIVSDASGSLGATGNFSKLMEVSLKEGSGAPYIFFSDQDDIWEPERVAVMLHAIRKLEDGRADIPAFLFTDLRMIDDEGRTIAPSLWRHEGLDPRRTGLNQLLVQNVPYGCATVINRALLELACPIDERALLHDHWMALLAAAYGRISHIDAVSIRHRIHGLNASRANNPIRRARDRSARAILGNQNFNRYFSQLQAQAEAVKERLSVRGPEKEVDGLLTDFITLRDRSLPARKWTMIKRGFFKHSGKQSLKWLLRI